MENYTAHNVTTSFRYIFNCHETIVARSPGRINIIGEHTDYNGGFVLPAAIDKAIYVALSKRDDEYIHLHSVEFSKTIEVKISEIRPTADWSTYILGVVDQLITNRYSVSGFNLSIDGDIPLGAGLSSSAAVECAVVYALNELFNLDIDKMDMVKLAQKAEQSFSGVMCGIMDMFASMFGKKDQVIKLDCRSLAYEYRPLKLPGYKILLFDTKVRHSLSSSAYNTRRQQCEQGVEWVKRGHPDVKSLRDVTAVMLSNFVLPRDKEVFARCTYVVEEIRRVTEACNDLEYGNIHALGKRMFETHEGLSKLYEVSCNELDFLVNAVSGDPSVLGARMMGGGFGGCTINIAKEEAIPGLIERLSVDYRKTMGIELSAYVSSIEEGTGLVCKKELLDIS